MRRPELTETQRSSERDIKTARLERKGYGGTANVAYDQCYHLRCDTLANVNYKALDQMSDAAAHTALTLAERDFRRKPLENPPPLASGPGDQSGGGGLHADHGHEGESH